MSDKKGESGKSHPNDKDKRKPNIKDVPDEYRDDNFERPKPYGGGVIFKAGVPPLGRGRT